jgi:hypothetical protein
MSEIVTVEGDRFSGVARLDGPLLNVLLEGTADYAAADDMDSLLSRAHAEAVQADVIEAVVDLRQLEFMNSTCFRSIVTWITDINELADKRYKVKFLSNPQLYWQKRSLHSIQAFAPDLVTIVEST